MKKKKLFARALGLLLAFLLTFSLTGNSSAFAKNSWKKAPANTKIFTVTKRPVNDPNATEEKVGDYDTFHDAMENCKQDDLSNLYIITMNNDYKIPKDEYSWGKLSVNILLRSAEGGPFTLTREGNRDIASIYGNCDLRIENVILDGNQDGEAFFLSENGKLTLGKGAVVQNFIDIESADGPAIYMINTSTLNIEQGAVIRNNRSDDKNHAGFAHLSSGTTLNITGGEFYGNQTVGFGGVFQSFGTVHISGGTFSHNFSERAGGAIAAYGGSVNITGGTFKENSSNSTGGALFLKKGTYSLKGASLINNVANYGGALFVGEKNLNELEISNCNLENNSANFGGGIYILTSETTIKGTSFKNNKANKYGGAIYCYPNDFNSPITKADAYKNLTTDEKTLFQGNTAGNGLFNPPTNYSDYSDALQFDPKSDVLHKALKNKSLLNNYDVNFKAGDPVPIPDNPKPNPPTPSVSKEKSERSPEKINGYYPFRPYFVTGKNTCQMIRDWGEEDVQEMLDAFNAHASWFKENHVPDGDQIAEHINMHGYELLAKEYNDEYGTISFRFGNPVTLAEWKNTLNKDTTFKVRFADPAEETIKDVDENGKNRQGIRVNNKTYYVPVYIDYKPTKYKVFWEIVPNQTSIEKAMGYWPGRDINEEYDRLVGGSPFKAELWAIKNIGKPDPCKANAVAFPLPDYRTHDKAGLWFYAPAVAPKAVKVKDSNPAQYKVTFEYIFAGTETYQEVYRK